MINLENPSMVLEISTGEFDEDDIVQLKIFTIVHKIIFIQ